MKSTKKDERLKIQYEQKLLAEFNSIIKTMDSIVFLAYGNQSVDVDVNIYASNLALLHYALWKTFEVAYGQSYSFINFNAMRMFILPAMQGSWQVNNVAEFSYINSNPLDKIIKKAYTNSNCLFNDLNIALNIKRENATEPLKIVNLKSIKNEENDLEITIKMLDNSLKAERTNQKLLIIIICTAYLCAADTKKLNYEQSMSFLFRLSLLLWGDEFLEEAKNEFAVYFESMQKAIKDYKLLNGDSRIKNIMDFLFENADNSHLLIIERELFRITQSLFRLKSAEEDVHEYRKIDISHVLNKLFMSTTQTYRNNLGCDEENFYYLLDYACRDTQIDVNEAKEDS